MSLALPAYSLFVASKQLLCDKHGSDEHSTRYDLFPQHGGEFLEDEEARCLLEV